MIEIEEQERIPFKKNRSFSSFINGGILSVVAILIVVIFAAYMTNISSEASISWQDVCSQGILMYVCTVSIYLLLHSYSLRKGRQTEKYEKAIATLEKNNKDIINKGYAGKIADYCREWEDIEHFNARKRVLAEIGITVEEFNEKFAKYGKKELAKAYPELTEHQREIILKAKKVKGLKYDESYLSVHNKGWRRTAPSGGIKTKTVIKLKTLQTFATTAVTSLFSISMTFEIIANPSFATVVACLVKVIITLIFGILGMVGGYNTSAIREVDEFGAKADEQERFIKWCENAPKIEKGPVNTESV